jgi:hypothetical protein
VRDTEKRETILVKNSDELIEIVDKRFSERKELSENVKPKDILWAFVIGSKEDINAVQLFDERTEQIYDNYWFYMANPALINNSAWFQAVKRLNRIYQRRTW